MKYKAQVNNHFEIAVRADDLASLDIVPVGKDAFHIIKDDITYKASIVAINLEQKQFHIKVNGRDYELKLEDRFDQLVNELGLEVASGTKLSDVKAPMPGLVLDIAVSSGQAIQKGDKLLILEAMKMENVIKADGDGIVKTIHIEKGLAVEKGQLMIEME